MTRSSAFLEYMKLHLISLKQDMELLSTDESYEKEDTMDKIIYLNGQILATEHLLSVATDIMNSTNERVYE